MIDEFLYLGRGYNMIYDHECIDYEELMTMFYPGPKGELKRYQKELNAFVMTFQLTERCNFKCSYCYQINKTPKTLKFEYAKKMIDEIFNPNSTLKNYITVDDKKAFCLEFIGGEPFLEVELMDQICEYFINSAIKNDSIFAVNFMISFWVFSKSIDIRNRFLRKRVEKA